MNYLALDMGSRKVGVAIGSSVIREARPVAFIPTREQHLQGVVEYVQQWQVKTIVIGDPGPQEENRPLLEYIQSFKAQLQQALPDCELIDWSEQGTSQEAKSIQRRTKKYEYATDSLAAMLILQSYFDRL